MSDEDKLALVNSVIKHKEEVLGFLKRTSKKQADLTVLMYEIGGMEAARDLYMRGKNLEEHVRRHVENRPKIHTRAYAMGMYLVAKIVQ